MHARHARYLWQNSKTRRAKTKESSHCLLVAGNILRLDDSGDILYMNPGIEALADIRDGPDESDTITVDELLDLENDVLCSAAETNEQCYSFALSDLAASSAPKSNEFNQEEEEAEEGDVDDDDK